MIADEHTLTYCNYSMQILSNEMIIDIQTIVTLHRQCILIWNDSNISFQHQGFYQLVEENHAFNFQLWHAEDRARRDDKGHHFVYQAKREIDFYNQQRNNRMEALDEWLYAHLQPEKAEFCPIHSESPGMIIDRLSILSLKSYHMSLQAKRANVEKAHKALCVGKLKTINQQWEQLALCLEQFLDEILKKKRTFRIYHQFKMYNDPTLNPQLYSE